MPSVNSARNRRLSQLERILGARASRVAEQRARAETGRQAMEAAWQIMRSTMSPDHARLFIEKYGAALRDGWDSLRGDPTEHFVHHCSGVLRGSFHQDREPYCQIRPEVRYAMPPEVAQVYLDHWRYPHTALPVHDCEDCGFKVPVIYGNRRNIEKSFFEQCPLCGGKIGWYAYYLKHSD